MTAAGWDRPDDPAGPGGLEGPAGPAGLAEPAELAELAGEVRAGRAAVLVVDMQNDFCHPGGALGARGADVSVNAALVGPVDAFVRRVRDVGARIVIVTLSREPGDASPLPGFVDGVCLAGSWGAAVHDGLHVDRADLVVRKPRYSAFLHTDLETTLRDWGVRTLLVVGTTANVCVDSTVRDAAQLDYRVVVLSDLVGHLRADLAEAALRNLSHYFATVHPSAALLGALSPNPGP
ncbi:MAG TPA: isochorismatase family cysteine hydrolase [Mycobacteriales bacterium]|nr:isochorismatase family cysteine hydrolase [Mycobacteriales bacterium]